PAPMQPGKIRVTTEDELKRFAEIVELGATGIPLTDSTSEELDELASALVNLLTTVVKAAGRPARKGGRLAPWWTEDFSSSSAVFKAVRWLKSPGAFQPPPLQVDNVVFETQMDKANALRQATLERRTADDDIDNTWASISPSRSIPFSNKISLDEAQHATIHTDNTSPGADNITVNLLKAAWHIIGTHVRRLFEKCLTIGHHPKPFKEAEVVMIAKPGRRDLTSPRAWRPISLLSCLGKGLERLIARRLAWAAVYFGVLHP
ncbi:reverse transcriptase, partial [Fusarium austroafricanum]